MSDTRPELILRFDRIGAVFLGVLLTSLAHQIFFSQFSLNVAIWPVFLIGVLLGLGLSGVLDYIIFLIRLFRWRRRAT